jgi:Ca2+:H+ antiporter
LAWAILLASPFVGGGGLVDAAAGAVLVATVFAAVHHAEVVAHRTGEPFGTLILAVAVTIIEVALIVSVMVAAPAEKAALARDTVFAAVMIGATASSACACCGAVPAITNKDFKSMGPVPPWRYWPHSRHSR